MNPVLCALIRISHLSLGQISEQLSLLKSNLLSAIIGKRSLPGRVMDSLFPLLGLRENGVLRSDVLHRWHFRSLDHLAPLLLDGPLGHVALYPLVTPRKSAQKWDHWLLCSSNGFYGIVRGRSEKLGEHKLDGLDFGCPVPVDDPTLCWKTGMALSVVSMLLSQAASSDKAENITWSMVVSEAIRQQIDAGEVMQWIRSKKKE